VRDHDRTEAKRPDYDRHDDRTHDRPESRSEGGTERRLARMHGKARAADGNAPRDIAGGCRVGGDGGSTGHGTGKRKGKDIAADWLHAAFLLIGTVARLQWRVRWTKNAAALAPVDGRAADGADRYKWKRVALCFVVAP